nr:laccase domain-containing protein [Myxococcota bacterium]
GPAAGPCCYEVDAPVIDALTDAYPDHASARLHPAREGHAMADLAGLAADVLAGCGIAASRIDGLGACTICDAARFHSYRRDGASAGRLCHWIAAS